MLRDPSDRILAKAHGLIALLQVWISYLLQYIMKYKEELSQARSSSLQGDRYQKG